MQKLWASLYTVVDVNQFFSGCDLKNSRGLYPKIEKIEPLPKSNDEKHTILVQKSPIFYPSYL